MEDKEPTYISTLHVKTGQYQLIRTDSGMSRERAVEFLKQEGNSPWKIHPETVHEFSVVLDGNTVIEAK